MERTNTASSVNALMFELAFNYRKNPEVSVRDRQPDLHTNGVGKS